MDISISLQAEGESQPRLHPSAARLECLQDNHGSAQGTITEQRFTSSTVTNVFIASASTRSPILRSSTEHFLQMRRKLSFNPLATLPCSLT